MAAGAEGWGNARVPLGRGGGGDGPPLRLRRPRAPPGLVLVQGARGCDGTGLLPWAADQTVGLNRVRSVRRASLCGCSGLAGPVDGSRGRRRAAAGPDHRVSVPSQSLRFGQGADPP